MPTPKLIMLAIPWEGSYCRLVMRGVSRYIQANPSLELAMPLDDVDPDMELMKRCSGVLAMTWVRKIGPAADRWGIPMVNLGAGPGACRPEEHPRLQVHRIDCHDDSAPEDQHPHVGVDMAATGELAVEYLSRLGARSYALYDYCPYLYARQRGRAFREALARRGHSCDVFDIRKDYPPLDGSTPVAFNPIDHALARWLATLPKPAALFAPQDILALRVSRSCRDLAIRIPEDIAVLAADNDELAGWMVKPPLSSISFPAEEIGFAAAHLLHSMICGHKPPRQIVLPPAGVNQRHSTDITRVTDPVAAQALRLIREKAHRGLCVEDLLESLMISRTTLDNAMQKAVGRSPFAEIRRLRIDKAKQLLAETDADLTSVAEACGFSCLSRFIPAFKQAAGMTPGQYRQRFRTQLVSEAK